MPNTRPTQWSNVGLPKEVLIAIGHVAALWARIEYTIDRKISEALALPDAPKIDHRLMVPFNKRLEILAGLCEQYLPAKNLPMARRIIKDLKQLSGLRNLIVHGAMPELGEATGKPGAYWFMCVRWDTPNRIVEKRALTAVQIEAFAARLSDRFGEAGMFEVFFWAVHAVNA